MSLDTHNLEPIEESISTPLAQVVVCPRCSREYQINQPVPENGLVFTCEGCKAKLIIRPKPVMKENGPGPGPGPGLPDPVPDPVPVPGSREAVCPRCLKKFPIPPGSPDQWVMCPQCGERFLDNRTDPVLAALGEAPVSTNFRPKKVSFRTNATVSYGPDLVRQVYEVGVVEYPPGRKKKIIITASVVVFVFLLLYGRLLVSSWQEAEELVDKIPPAKVAAVSEVYGDQAFQKDMIYFFRWSKDKSFSRDVINTSGNVSRIFKYAMARLAPGECQEITSLTLSSTGGGGVRMVGQCYNENQSNPVVLVSWPGRQAVLSVPNSREIIDVTIFPPDPNSPPEDGSGAHPSE
jgi:DNA-directed RNA polymerase subunit RPC12/RpoP